MGVIQKVKDRTAPGEDIGLDHGAQKGRQRTINRDGSYNMQRKTGRCLGNFHLYHWLINASWRSFWLFAFTYYGVMNLLFAIIYYMLGPDSLGGMVAGDSFTRFMYCFFFSAQSFTTVGYGGLHPLSKLA